MTHDRKGTGKGTGNREMDQGVETGEARNHRRSVMGARSLPIVAASSPTTPTMDDRFALFGGGC